MSDFEKNEELSRKYGEVMDSIANDIRQINLDEREPVVLTGSGSVSENADLISAAVDDLSGDSPIVQAEAGNNGGLGDDVFSLKSVSDDLSDEFDDTPLSNIGDFDKQLLKIQGYDSEADDFEDVLTCDECRDMLYDFVSDALDETETGKVNAHLKNCEMCRIELDDIRDMLGVLSSDLAQPCPKDLISKAHNNLVAIAPEVKEEYARIRSQSKISDKLLSAFENIKTEGAKLVKNANWRVVAPAAMSAVLVMGVAGSGIYQIMKSSDELYDFSDNAAIANAKATAKPSSSGLDEYLDDGNDSLPSPRSSARPSAASSPGASSPSRATAAPRATSRPAASSSGSSSTARSSSGTSRSSSSRSSTSGSSSSSNRSTAGSSAATNRSTASSRSSATRAPSPTATPAYRTPRIILPDISSNTASPTYVPPEGALPSIQLPDIQSARDTSQEDGYLVGGAGGESVPAAASADAEASEPTEAPETATPAPTAAPVPTATPQRSQTAASTAAPVHTPAVTAEPKLDRNSEGETEAYRAVPSERLNSASLIRCSIDSKEVYDALMNSALANCSKINQSGEAILYFTSEEYSAFTDFMTANDLTYTLMSLGTNNNNDVKVIIAPQAD
ncbi:MAG TPA: zf-HC2 domain-containing protein [Candidatus Monoglobus merdigallinarum]|uniref:Anti-sigma-W factor RsiW n=1 Tax=Candidatus Monoglobus merdigallinarum TaxID=2838698 RepID=A0A9D1TMU5_9FIRM|nr:zf-HC2 domain-containing protein [Candidatus Monoglobus merdigallinarum]